MPQKPTRASAELNKRTIEAAFVRDGDGRLRTAVGAEAEALKKQQALGGRDRPAAKRPTDGTGSTELGATEIVKEAGLPVEDAVVEAYLAERTAGLTRIYHEVKLLGEQVDGFLAEVDAGLPHQLSGEIVLPDGRPGAGLMVTMPKPRFPGNDAANAKIAWTVPMTVTDTAGVFVLDLPRAPLPVGTVTLRIQGADGATDVTLHVVDIADGKAGLITLRAPLRPAAGRKPDRPDPFDRPESDAAGGEAEPSAEAIDAGAATPATPPPSITLGDGPATLSFGSNRGVIDKFSYSILVRLTEPLLGQAAPVFTKTLSNGKIIPQNAKTLAGPLLQHFGADDLLQRLQGGSLQVQFRDRVAIDEPVDVDGFRTMAERLPAQLPKASTLALGYIVTMRQTWLPDGYSLGDLVYSLPLAPGEEQRIAVVERQDTQEVRDVEQLTDEERQSFDERADSSVDAVFNSAARDMTSGGSSTNATSHVWGVGGGIGAGAFINPVLVGGGVAGGYGGANSSGSTEAWQNATRDVVSETSEQLSTSVARQAAARRTAQRVGIRLARATAREEAVTKIIANYNHSHALTVQYWEVLRHYQTRTEVDGVQLCVFVPLELVAWLPPGEPAQLPTTTGALNRDALIARYGKMLRYLDVLEPLVARRRAHRRGLELARQLGADPTVRVSGPAAAAGAIVSLSLVTNILPFEEVTAVLVFRDGRRSRPVTLQGGPPPIEQGVHTTYGAFEEALRAIRDGDGSTLTAQILLGPQDDIHHVARLELRRALRPVTVQLDDSALDAYKDLGLAAAVAALSRRYSGAELDELVGPLDTWDISAAALIGAEGLPVVEAHFGRQNAASFASLYALAARRVPPVLSYDHVLEIEGLFQHVVRNTVAYSRAVWAALSPDERALMLERFTIGIPEGGFGDDASEIPLLNCVTNRVIGFFGNAMILPFQIPPPLAAQTSKTSADLQDALLRFHRGSFRLPRGSITLPTRGVLAEAVLGTSNASEKIDLTRFWNWQDSPHRATSPAIDALTGRSLIPQGAEGPAELAQRSTLSAAIDALARLPQPQAGQLAAHLLQGLGGVVPNAPNITGLDQLNALLQATTSAAAQAQKTSVEQGVAIGSKALDMLPQTMAAAAQYDQVQADLEAKRAETEDKRFNLEREQFEAGQRETADRKARNKREAAERRLKELVTPATADDEYPYLKVIGQSGDSDQALDAGRQVIDEILEGQPPTASMRAAVSFWGDHAEQSLHADQSAERLGLWAVRKLLGLNPGDPPGP